MPLDKAAARQRIQKFDFPGLFTQELGWDWHKPAVHVSVAGRDFTLQAVAEKRGFVAWHCPAPDGGKLPDSALRRRIEREITKSAHEHLVIFTDAARTMQVWQWVRREPGKPLRIRETLWTQGQSGELLVQKLEPLFVSLDEEETLTLVDVTGRAAGNVDERVTKRFYEEFRKQHGTFLKFITGIPNQGDHEWYASVMLNRLMFLYFIQKKRFLDDDLHYLRIRLQRVRAEHGKDKFYSFYRSFLLKLFHGGLNTRLDERLPDLEKLIGRVPYLNGGIFDVHKLERPKKEGGYGDDIQIPDKAFEAIFDYFDRYQWHLDERPLRADNEINPDVLGYIFEKYINQKQMGAYYTKEDITGYIGQNTILPFLFDKVAQSPSLRSGPGADALAKIWQLLRDDPDRYIYPAVRHGVSWTYEAGHPDQGVPLEKERPLPADVAAGLDAQKPKLLERRRAWNKPATPDCGLPTEIWRETIARRQRYAEARKKLADGEVRDIADFITHNLDIRRFAQDVISRCDSPELLAALWHTLAGRTPEAKSTRKPLPALTILDPTCGSGAFLFAALGILQPLYESCLDRMEGLLADARAAGTKIHHESHLAEFETILQHAHDRTKHPSERYFIFKTIILHNLYGVDLMEEAVEICKLRLFLKLAAQVEPDAQDKNLGIEPLPDIDFNIRAGNTLVGYATRAELEAVGKSDLLLQAEVGQVLEAAEDAAAAYDTFIRSQLDGENPAAFKRRLNEKFGHAREQCDRFLAESYELGLAMKPRKFSAWKQSHQPFHWFVEFFGILSSGGFDVIIGNPPYVEYKDVKDTYTVRGFRTLESGDLYAFTTERAYALTRTCGRIGLIVPISLFGVDGFSSLQSESRRCLDAIWASSFANRPAQLFDGAQKRLTIIIGCRGETKQPKVHTTAYFRWRREEFETLFAARVAYAPLHPNFSVFPASLEKLGSALENSAFAKITASPKRLEAAATSVGKHRVYYTRKFGYFLGFFDFVPRVTEMRTGRQVPPSELKELCFSDSKTSLAVVAALSSSSFFWFWNVLSDCRNLNRRDILAFPITPTALPNSTRDRLAALGEEYIKTLKRTSYEMQKSGLKLQTFEYGTTKPILDEIDAVLAEHYGFTAEELDFIVNYDLKYRLGRGDEEEE